MTDALASIQDPSTVVANTTSASPALAAALAVMDIEIKALLQMRTRLNDSFETALAVLMACKGRVIVTGMGKSGLIGKKIAATMSSTGTPAFFLHPGEGMHGDLGLMMPEDVVIAISNSGETAELLSVLPVIEHFKCPLIAMTGRMNSTLAQRAQVVLDVGVEQEACPLNLAPTSSTTATLVMGDALAVALMKAKGFKEQDFAVFHPAGSLGKRLLLKVSDVMRSGDALPIVAPTDSFKAALVEITSKKLGMTLVQQPIAASHQGWNQQTIGIVTDGDVRRTLMSESNLEALTVADVMTAKPKMVGGEALAVEALQQMEAHKITVLCVVDDEQHTVGVVHLHDLLDSGL